MVMDFEQTDDGTIWASTASTYIFGFHPGSSEPEAKQAFNVDYTFIPSLLKLNNGQMLISAFYQDITQMDPQTGKLTAIEIPDMETCIRRSVYIPTDMHQDAKGDVWIGTVSNGLLSYDPKTNTLTRIAGLSCSDVGSIEEDPSGRQDRAHNGSLQGRRHRQRRVLRSCLVPTAQWKSGVWWN